jgi:hypothetical protein
VWGRRRKLSQVRSPSGAQVTFGTRVGATTGTGDTATTTFGVTAVGSVTAVGTVTMVVPVTTVGSAGLVTTVGSAGLVTTVVPGAAPVGPAAIAKAGVTNRGRSGRLLSSALTMLTPPSTGWGGPETDHHYRACDHYRQHRRPR